jgi:uncharacterized alpha/beta hydrolase family protein
MNKAKFKIIIVLSMLVTMGLFVSQPIYGQNQSGGQQQQSEKQLLPVLLIHGYVEDAAVW